MSGGSSVNALFSRSPAPKALIAMSGGVDSSVAAYLMRQEGYDCAGAMMKLYGGDEDIPAGRTCCSLADSKDARSVASRLEMPFYVFNYTAEFERKVIGKFCAEYMAGRTPNPCIDCNRFMKFDALLQRARLMGCSFIATGHYARIERSGSRWLLRKAFDSSKDQSYVLYTLRQSQLESVKLPLGSMMKEKVRALAAELEFWNAEKPDSQDICFVPDGNYGSFLERRLSLKNPEGDFIDSDGNTIARHRGHYRYTIGQRKGLGLAFDSPRYVISKNPATNTVTLGRQSELARRECELADINLIAVDKIEYTIKATVRTRYHQEETPCTVTQTRQDTLNIVFDHPQPAVAPGQAAVIYDGEYVIGGGTIQ